MSRILSVLAAGYVLVSASAFAAPQETISDDKAYLTFSYCPAGVSDCGDGYRINVKGKAYYASGNTPAIQKQLDNVAATYQFHKLTRSAAFSVTGYTQVKTNTGGWGPRTYTVFMITQSTMGSMPLPKGIPSAK